MIQNIAFLLFFVATVAQAEAPKSMPKTVAKRNVVRTDPVDPKKKIVYAEGQTLDFEGLSLEGELKTPGEFYFQNRNQERFDSLTKRRLNFHREMLRDSVQSQ